MMLPIELIFLFLLLVVIQRAEGISKKEACGYNKQHVYCLFEDKVGSKCGSKSEGGVSDADIKTILKEHNDFRQKVASGKEKRGKPGPQPKAKDMPKLVWDADIAKVAQSWANQCNYGHSCTVLKAGNVCKRTKKYENVGQNIALNRKDWPAAIKGWTDEVKDFDNSGVKSFGTGKHGGKVGHYTQIVWDKTVAIGCGFRVYPKKGGDKYYVCNYAPAGNWNYNGKGLPIYRTARKAGLWEEWSDFEQ